jgi:hypothetical protein
MILPNQITIKLPVDSYWQPGGVQFNNSGTRATLLFVFPFALSEQRKWLKVCDSKTGLFSRRHASTVCKEYRMADIRARVNGIN